MTDKEITSLFDNAGRSIIEQSEELEKLRTNYGEKSKLVLTKQKQVDNLIAFHDGAQRLISEYRETMNNYQNALKLSAVVHKYKDIHIMQKDTGLPWGKVAKIYNLDSVPTKEELDNDTKINKHIVYLSDLIYGKEEE